MAQILIKNPDGSVSSYKDTNVSDTPASSGTGTAGAKGDKGDTGPQGIPGVKGDKGDQGINGVAGSAGAKGDQGIQGIKGDTGSNGIQGVKGDLGPQGPAGNQGDKGLKGDQGNQGPQGIPGVNGTNGIDGKNGADSTVPGPKGDTGSPGATGGSGLGSMGLAVGPVPSATAFAMNTTPATLPLANSAIPCIYLPSVNSAYMGCTIGNLGLNPVVFQLYNQTTATAIVSHTCPAQTIMAFGLFGTSQYPLASNNQYVWRVTSSTSQSAAIYVLPSYLTPSNTPTQSVTYTGTSGFSTPTTFTSTPQILPVMGNTTANPWELLPYRSGYLYQAIATFIPTGSSTSSTTATLQFYVQASNNAVLRSFTITATSQPVILATYLPTDVVLNPTNFQYYWRIIGANVTGLISVETLCVL